jgi:hypothetical protein
MLLTVVVPIIKAATKAAVFATLKVKKKATVVTSKLRTALFQEGENDVTVSSKIIAYESSGEKAIARASEDVSSGVTVHTPMISTSVTEFPINTSDITSNIPIATQAISGTKYEVIGT